MKTILTLFGILLISSFTSLHAGKIPTWPELEALLGQQIESKEFQEFVTQHDALLSGKGGAGHFSPVDYPYSIQYKPIGGLVNRRMLVSNIVIRVEVDGVNWKPYSGDLPAGLKHSDLKKDIEAKFGKSQPASDDNFLPSDTEKHTWVVHALEITICFNKVSGKIVELGISKVVKDGAKKNGRAEQPADGKTPEDTKAPH